MKIINQNDITKFLEIMDRWLRQPLFQNLSRIRHERNWANIMSLKENNYSDILQWLFSTDGGHGLGDYFLKKFIFAVMELASENILNSWKSSTEIDLLKLNSVVVREVENKGNERGFIDILIIDFYNKIVVAIERKDGSTLKKRQLSKYYQWIDEKYISNGYKCLCVVSDSNERVKSVEEQWVLINDDWLQDALNFIIGKDLCPPRIEQQLSDLANLFDWREERDKYFIGVADEISNFVRLNTKEVQALRVLKPFGIPLIYKHDTAVVSDIIPQLFENINSDFEKTVKAAHLIIKYRDVFDWILDSDYFDLIIKEVDSHVNYKGNFLFNSIISRNGKYHIDITHKDIEFDDEYWTFWIQIVVDAKNDEEQNPSESLNMKFYYDKNRLYWNENVNRVLTDYIANKYPVFKKGKVLASVAASTQEVIRLMSGWLNDLQELGKLISKHRKQ